MAVEWKTPPTISNANNTAADNFVKVVKKNLQAIKDAMIKKAIADSGLTSGHLSATTVGKIIDKLVIGPTHKAEGGWSDHPSDGGGPTMRGVTLSSFRGSFNRIFISTGVKDVVSAAKTFKSLGWATGEVGTPGWETGKQVLYKVCNDADISSLWIFAFATSKANKYPAAVMASEPYLGYLMHCFGWASGAGYFNLYKCPQALKPIGYTPNTSLASTVRQAVVFNDKSLVTDNAFPISLQLLQNKFNWIINSTQPGSKNEPFREGWLNRLIYNPSISYTHNLVNFGNSFEDGTIASTTEEQDFLSAKAKLYKQTVITFPDIT